MYWTRNLLIMQITIVHSSQKLSYNSTSQIFKYAIITKIYKNRKLIRTYTKLVSYKERRKKFYLFLSFDNLSTERFLNHLLANYVFLNFDLLSVRTLNFSKISSSFLVGPFFIIGDCVYYLI